MNYFTPIETRKFKERGTYSSSVDGAYFLLPFKFERINEKREVLVNEIGDFLVVPIGSAERIINRKIVPSDPLYADLLGGFFISDHQPEVLLEVMAARYRTQKSFLEYFTGLHIFVITLRCDQACHYCQVSRVSEDRSAFDMTNQNLDRSIDLMFRSPNPRLTMEFQGGEPLLVFDRIGHAVERAERLAHELKKEMTYVICTSLSKVTREMLHFCKEHNVLISTSLDGPEFIHNKNRLRHDGNSYELSLRGIQMCREILGDDRVSALMTATALSLEHPREIVDEYVNLGFPSIFLRPINPYGFALKNERQNRYETIRFLEFYKEALDHIINYNKQGFVFVEDYARIILSKILTPFSSGYVDLQSPAGIINSVVVYNYDGKVYVSDEARMLAEMGDTTFQLGDAVGNSYEEIFAGEKAQIIAEVWANESLPGCSDCGFRPYCGADPVRNYSTQGDMVGYRPTSSFCQKNMEIIRALLEMMDNDKSVEAIFRRWLSPRPIDRSHDT